MCGLESEDTRLHRSPSPSGGEVQSHWTRGSVGVHVGREAGSGAVGHVTASEPTLTGRQGLELQGTRQHVDARLAPSLVLKPTHGVPGLLGTDNTHVMAIAKDYVHLGV
jgi:hypothetical protein